MKFHKRSFLFIYLFITLIKRVSLLRRLYKQSGWFRSVWKQLYVANFKGLAQNLLPGAEWNQEGKLAAVVSIVQNMK